MFKKNQNCVFFCVATVFFVIAFSPVTPAHSKPFFEAGIAGGMGYIPDYPAAGQSRIHGLVFPVFQLRGKVFRSDDEEGTRARLFKDMATTFDISLSGSFPADSKKNEARSQMPDLDWIGEMGPRLQVRLRGNERHFIKAALAARVAFSTNFNRVDFRGLVLAPSLIAEHKKLILGQVDVSARITSQFASREMHAYFYDVEPMYATPKRREFTAKGGYLGTNVFAVFAFEQPSYALFSGFGASFHDAAANTQSPLFRERVNASVFLGFRWFFYQSQEPGHP